MGEVRVGGGGIDWEVGVHSRTEHLYVCYIIPTNDAVLGSTLGNPLPLLLSRPSLTHDCLCSHRMETLRSWVFAPDCGIGLGF